MARSGLPTVYRKTGDDGKPIDHPKPGAFEDGRWWLEAEGSRDAALKATQVLQRNWRSSDMIRMDMTTSWRLYDNTPIAGLTPKLYRPKVPTARMRRIPWNLVKSVCDTYTSLICKETPKVSFITSGGNRTLQRKAMMSEKFVDGVLYDNHFNGHTNIKAVRSSAVFGEGIVKVYADYTDPENPRIGIDEVRPYEVFVDEHEAMYGNPQNIQTATWVDRYALAAEYPDKEADIMKTMGDAFHGGGSGMTDLYSQGEDNSMCLVVESWHLPRIPGRDGSRDGRHLVTCGAVVLIDEPWYRATTGLVWLYRQRPLAGVHGQSLPIELAPIQVEIAKTLHNAALAMTRAAGHWLVPDGADVNTNALDDRLGSIIRFTGGMPPEFKAYQAMSPETIEYLNLQWQRGFEMVGVSANAAASERPAGLNSGKAQMVYADIQQQRFDPSYKEYQQWYVAIAREVLDVAAEIAADHSDFEVSTVASKNMISSVRYLDAHLEKDEFVLQLLPTNKLADDPAAKLAWIQESMNSGLMDQETGKRLNDSPDVAEYNAYEFARYDYVMCAVDKILDEGDFVAPDPEALGDFLMSAVQMVEKAYAKACLDGVEPKHRMLLLKWRDVAKSYAEAPPQPAMPAPGPEAGAPPPGPAPARPPGPEMGPPNGAPPLAGMVQHDLMRSQASQTAQQLGQ